MKEKAYSLLFVLIICSCRQSAIKQNFSSTDSLVIHFKNEQTGIIAKTVQTTESNAISRIIEFIDSKTSEDFKCGYDGKMFFYFNTNQIQEVDFKMSDKTCNHFSFLLNGKLISTNMKTEAVDILMALEKGLPYY